MSSLIGQTFGQYRIVEKIGAGGMATVYKAYQPRLDRTVAIKVLPPTYAKQPGFSERFQREAKAIASLNHPNILPVHDFGQEGAYTYIVMRYVEDARTLKAVMARPLRLSQVIDLIGQIAAALDYAHQGGVVHRDVKPGNVLMDGNWALLTDFGLAKIMADTSDLTGTGVGIGTPAYMSPEQGQGQPVDHRTDIYALGTILFEMLTGRLPYEAETPVAIVFKRASEPLPLLRNVNPDIPDSVEQIILKALALNPDDRFASAGEMATTLKESVGEAGLEEMLVPPPAVDKPTVVHPPQAQQPSTPTPLPSRPLLSWPWLVGLFAIIGMTILCVSTGLIITWLRQVLPDTEQEWASFIFPPTPTKTATPVIPTPTATPSRTPTPTPPTNTPLPPTPTKTPLPPHITPSPTPTGGRIAFVSERDGNQEIYIMYADGSGLTNLTNHPANDWTPAWAPDGRHLAFDSNRIYGGYNIYVMNVENVLQGDDSGLARLTHNTPHVAFPAWSPDGRIAFELIPPDEGYEIYMMNADGSGMTRLTNHPANDRNPSWAPDGKYIVFDSDRNGNRDLYVMNVAEVLQDIDGAELTRLTNHPDESWHPAWSPDGTRIAFTFDYADIYILNIKDTPQGLEVSEPTSLTGDSGSNYAPAWSPDGQQIAFHSFRDGNFEIYVMNADGSNRTRLTHNSADDWWPSWGK
jgi:Tol biopolymer transport system component/tRNA A-37 threonylcarbamoyl transferase component Bud32